MTLATIIQSNYLPWRGYFDLIDDVDIFIVYDDVQYTRRDWRNRNKIKMQSGPQWITVPVNDRYGEMRINEVTISPDHRWAHKHLKAIEHSYSKAPYFDHYFPELAQRLSKERVHLNDLNLDLISWIREKLSISTEIVRSSSLPGHGSKTERLLSILSAVGASGYVSGPSAKAYIEPDAFAKAGISLAYKQYDYGPYRQLWGDFEGQVTVLDLLFNVGPDARNHLKSRLGHQTVKL